jgi:hypothetical protein
LLLFSSACLAFVKKQFNSRLMLFRTSLIIASLFFTHSANALWVRVSDCELINSSNLIISGKFLGKTKLTTNRPAQVVEAGTIRVMETFKGSEIERIFIKQPLPSDPISSSDIVFHKDQTGIWFSNTRNFSNGIYSISHPQQFWPQNKVSEIRKLIETCVKSK